MYSLTENTQPTLIEVKSLDKKFGAIHAVNNLSFSVRKGEVLGFLGPNGAGKSTADCKARTPLHIAAAKGNRHIGKLTCLMEVG